MEVIRRKHSKRKGMRPTSDVIWKGVFGSVQNRQKYETLPIAKHNDDESSKPVLESTGDEVVKVSAVLRVSLARETSNQHRGELVLDHAQDPSLTRNASRLAAMRVARSAGTEAEAQDVHANL